MDNPALWREFNIGNSQTVIAKRGYQKMLFITPAIGKISQPKSVKKFTYACFPTSIGFLATYLRVKNNDEVRVVDEQIVDITKDLLEDELSRLGILRLSVSRILPLQQEGLSSLPGKSNT